MTIRQLSATDAGFLYAESASTPMHIAAVQVFDVPHELRAGFYASVLNWYAARLHRVPFFTRRLVPVQFGLDHPVWETCEVDLAQHIRYVKLPAPGTLAQLEALIAELHAKPLDRARPLWHYTLIEGFDGDRFVFYTKMHHAVLDGMAGQALLETMYSGSPNEDVEPGPVADVSPGSEEVHSNAVERGMHALREFADNARHGGERAMEGWNALRRLGAHVARGHELGAFARTPPATPFNVTVGRARSFAVGTLPLAEVRVLAKAQGVTINDVFMAVCAGALRDHLRARRALPAASLVAGVPVSIRGDHDAASGNHVTMMPCLLGTEIADPLTRLRAISASAKAGKQLAAITKPLAESDVHVPGLPNMLSAFARLPAFLPVGTPLPAMTNVVLSNVPGPRKPKFLAGARMLTHYPVSIPAHGAAVNFTVQSYCDRMDFAVTACRAALPDAGALRDLALAAWAELRDAGLPQAADVDEALVRDVAPVPTRAAA